MEPAGLACARWTRPICSARLCARTVHVAASVHLSCCTHNSACTVSVEAAVKSSGMCRCVLEREHCCLHCAVEDGGAVLLLPGGGAAQPERRRPRVRTSSEISATNHPWMIVLSPRLASGTILVSTCCT